MSKSNTKTYKTARYPSTFSEVETWHELTSNNVCNAWKALVKHEIDLPKRDFFIIKPQDRFDYEDRQLASYSPIFINTKSNPPSICKTFYTCVPPVKGINSYDGFLKVFKECFSQGNPPTFLAYDCKGYALGIGEVGYMAVDAFFGNTSPDGKVTRTVYGLGKEVGLPKYFDVETLKNAREFSKKKAELPNVLDNKVEDICLFNFKTGGDDRHHYHKSKDGDIVLYIDNNGQWSHAARYDSNVCDNDLFSSKLGVLEGLYCHTVEDVIKEGPYGDTEHLIGITTCANLEDMKGDL